MLITLAQVLDFLNRMQNRSVMLAAEIAPDFRE
jgi:hypothetical protein